MLTSHGNNLEYLHISCLVCAAVACSKCPVLSISKQNFPSETFQDHPSEQNINFYVNQRFSLVITQQIYVEISIKLTKCPALHCYFLQQALAIAHETHTCDHSVSSWEMLLRLPPRHQPIWTIYIPFESPRFMDFRNAKFDLKL